MPVLIVVLAALVVLAIAVVAVGRTTRLLASQEPLRVYDIEEAAEYIAERLPDRVAGRLTHDELVVMLRWHLTYWRELGLATYGGVDEVAENAALRKKGALAAEEDVIDYMVGRARVSEYDIDEVDVVVVLELESEYRRVAGILAAQPEDEWPD